MRLKVEVSKMEGSTLLDIGVHGWARDIKQQDAAGTADCDGEPSKGLDDFVLRGVPDDDQVLVRASRRWRNRLLL